MGHALVKFIISTGSEYILLRCTGNGILFIGETVVSRLCM